jgi:K+ transporter
MTEEASPILSLTEESLEALLKRAMRNTLLLGLVPALVLLFVPDWHTGWRNALMLATGTLISAASIVEWLRLVRLMRARQKKEKPQRGTILVLAFFLLRLMFFAAAIYVSLKCFQGSPLALLCGLGLAVATLTWEGLSLLKG